METENIDMMEDGEVDEPTEVIMLLMNGFVIS